MLKLGKFVYIVTYFILKLCRAEKCWGKKQKTILVVPLWTMDEKLRMGVNGYLLQVRG